jgi:TPP-dependent pyruvate/acetoin dehydrogenase alpha subunit
MVRHRILTNGIATEADLEVIDAKVKEVVEASVKFAEVNTVFNYETENDLQETNVEEFEEVPNNEDQSIEFEELA